MDTEHVFRILPEEAGIRADRYLAEHLPGYSRSYLQSLMEKQRLTIDGKPAKAGRKLRAGETLGISVPEPEEPEVLPEEIPLSILYEDDALLVVDKPKGMAVHPAPGHPDGTLVNALLAHCRGSLSGINGVLRPGIVHRIDKDTTGALIVCKTDEAHRSIAAQLEVHSITRRYLGIVTGVPEETEGTVTGNIGRDPKDRKKMAVVREGGKPAVTHYRVLEVFRGFALCEFELETGRTHQIRVHMASRRHPLLGDAVYGGANSRYPLEGQTLHAMVIGFVHPVTGAYMEFRAPLPDYFEQLLKKLRRESGA